MNREKIVGKTPRIKLPTKFPVTCHTRHVGIGSTFVAIKGQKQDGAIYIPQALKRGAHTIVVQYDTPVSPEIHAMIEQSDANLELVEHSRLALAQLSAKQSNYAHTQLKLIGITGTKGKTSTAFMLEHILQQAGHKTALISTVYNKILDTKIPAELTTEQPDYLHQFFKVCIEHGVEYVIMEVAAQALSLHRVAGLEFDAVIFTNFCKEHGEFYDTLEEYFAAKLQLFNKLKPHSKHNGFINTDDPWGQKILQQYPNFTTYDAHSFSANSLAPSNSPASTTNSSEKNHFTQKTIYTNTPATSNAPSKTITIPDVICPHLFGAFNKYNIAAATAVANSLGISLQDCTRYLKTFNGIPGRLEQHKIKNNVRCFIDYAHNPSSYQAVLATLRDMTDHLIVVFGAGGERDHEKRPLMGDIASQIADQIIVTSDNPRSEDPNQIIQDILAGVAKEHMHKVMTEPDRQQAIELACKTAPAGAIIAILGKGPDEYQIIGKTKTVFSEKAIIRAFR